MKTEKQVKDILKTVDERIVRCFHDKAEEYIADHNRTPEENLDLRNVYCQRLVALVDIAESMGYDWHRDIDCGIKRIRPSTVSVVNRKVTEGF